VNTKFIDGACDDIKNLAIACDCGELDHGVTMSFWPEDEDDKARVYLNIWISPNSFFERLKWMWRILFKTHHLTWWGETIFNKPDAKKLKEFFEQVDWDKKEQVTNETIGTR